MRAPRVITAAVGRRHVLAGMAAAAAIPAAGRPAERPVRAETLPPPMAGTLDLDTVPVVDAHMHPLARALLSAKYEEQAADFAGAMLPRGEDGGTAVLRARLVADYREHVMAVSRRIGYFNYVARVHGVPATQDGFDRALAPHLASDRAFAAYVRQVLGRERIAAVVLQSASAEPVRPSSAIPSDRFAWTLRITEMASAGWARARGLTTPAAVLRAIDADLQRAVANGCRGFKNTYAYRRPLALVAVTPTEAEQAMARLMAAAPFGTGRQKPIDDDPTVATAQRAYEDYVFRHIYVRAGLLDRPIVIHCAVVLHPALRPENNDPAALYGILTDPAMVGAGTRFVMIHTGYPSHHLLAAMNSQFPRLFVDVSHISKYPGALEEALRALIAVGPTTKVMHGSDTGTIPDEIGYCAFNTRRALARILSEYKVHYGWRQGDIASAANQILHENARRIFAIVEPSVY